MSTKTLVFTGMTIGGIIGGYVPMAFGAGIFSFWSIIGNLIGGLLGIYVGYKLGNW